MSVACLACRARIAVRRGNCQACYQRHLAAVRAGRATWEALQREGRAGPAQSRAERGRKVAEWRGRHGRLP